MSMEFALTHLFNKAFLSCHFSTYDSRSMAFEQVKVEKKIKCPIPITYTLIPLLKSLLSQKLLLVEFNWQGLSVSHYSKTKLYLPYQRNSI